MFNHYRKRRDRSSICPEKVEQCSTTTTIGNPAIAGEEFGIKRIIIIIILVIITCNVFADLKENDILKNRANQYRSRRQFEKAISIYEVVMKNDPEDIDNVYQLILVLIQTSKTEQAEKLLNDFEKKMPEAKYFQLKLMILLHGAEFKKAQNFSDAFLDKHRGNVNNYGSIAKTFEQYRQYDAAIEIYKKARKIANDDNLYVRELANNFNALKDYKNAVYEFIKLVEKKDQFASFVVNRFKLMLKEEPNIIKFIAEVTANNESPSIKEIYALSLGEIGDFEKALKEYENLPVEKIIKFADRLEKNGELNIAIKAYVAYLNRSVNLVENAKVTIKLSALHISLNELDKAEEILLTMYSNKELKAKRNRYKTRANRQCRELLAQISLMRNASQKEITKYLEEAKEFTFNKNDLSEIEYKLIHLLIMNEENDQAKEKLGVLLKNENSGSDTFKKGYYYSFLLAIMTNDAESDSLLGELLVNIPGDGVTIDALLLFQSTNHVQNNEDRESLLKAYRKRSLYKIEEAIDILRSIYDRSKVEDMLFLAGEWAIQAGRTETAIEIFSHDYTKPDLKQFAILKLAEIEENKSTKNTLCTGFLQNNPQSIFSPQFRKILGN